jgi:hypothetical protein
MADIETMVTDVWERTEQVQGRIDVSAVVEYARSQKATGELIFRLHEGGIRGAALVRKIQAEVEMTNRQKKELGV